MPTPNNDGFDIRAPRYIDLRQGKLVGGKSVPYSSTAELLATVLSTRRAEGLIMYVKNGSIIEEWWFVGGIADGNLVKKTSGIQSVQQGTNVTIDNTDPLNPIVNATVAAIDQDNIMHVVQVSLTDIGMTPSDSDADIQAALATYIEGMIIPEDEIWYFQLSGFPDSSGGTGGGSSPLITVTKVAADALILAGTLIPGQNYKITGVDTGLYGGTDIILKAASTTLFETKGSGFFYNPKYTQDPGWGIWTKYMESSTPFSAITGTFDYLNREGVTAQNGATGILVADGFIEWVSGDWSAATSITGNTSAATATVTGFTSPSYAIGANVIWGGKHWVNVGGNVGSANDDFELDAEWSVISFNETDYNLVNDVIEYDYVNDRVLFRSDNIGNEIKTT